ncbi:uncharacterized protein RAG0_12044 [Rhynchosporium agropyri]|uniref:Uncharacterized protein n=1 Tax=Rhynchosporium agropyri TaxID=914238 RepID=A0A1E1L6X7_9HELO|nr:uncharacterized protein RAG0_12044 [Rhynchosporium agropyri]
MLELGQKSTNSLMIEISLIQRATFRYSIDVVSIGYQKSPSGLIPSTPSELLTYLRYPIRPFQKGKGSVLRAGFSVITSILRLRRQLEDLARSDPKHKEGITVITTALIQLADPRLYEVESFLVQYTSSGIRRRLGSRVTNSLKPDSSRALPLKKPKEPRSEHREPIPDPQGRRTEHAIDRGSSS